MIRTGTPADALSISALATYVFFDTYCREGLTDHVAREAFGEYSESAFAKRLANQDGRFLLVHSADALVGYAELTLRTPCPVDDASIDCELARLYLHPRFQRRGIGTQLLAASERLAVDEGTRGLWLAAWVGNAKALAFYAARGLARVGSVDHVIEGIAYENHVLVRWSGTTTRLVKEKA